MNSSGDIFIYVVPSRHALFSRSTSITSARGREPFVGDMRDA